MLGSPEWFWLGGAAVGELRMDSGGFLIAAPAALSLASTGDTKSLHTDVVVYFMYPSLESWFASAARRQSWRADFCVVGVPWVSVPFGSRLEVVGPEAGKDVLSNVRCTDCAC